MNGAAVSPGQAAQWKPGQSGNPAGRPKGIVDRRNRVHAAFEEVGNQIAQVVIDAALGGDMQAANIALQRISPNLKPRGERVRFTLDATRPLAEQSAQVLTAIGEGLLAPDEAQIVLTCINTHAQIKAADDHEARLLALERKATHANGSSYGAGVVLLKEVNK